ncbi:MAG TPA: phosphatase domain-containing protein [Thermoanaerobaculia bacterium]|nr:phosphatase domain-containing protein [Thermoanaerobaculia bacterium]
MAWKDRLLGAATSVEDRLDRLKRHLAARGERDDPLHVVPFRGFGNRDGAWLCARVLYDQGVGTQGPADSLWDNVLNAWRRLESDEVPGVRVAARWGGAEVLATSDGEGYLELHLPTPPSLAADTAWHRVELETLALPPRLAARGPAPGDRLTAVGEVLVPPPGARFLVISDVDDTVLQTGATSKLAMARNVFLHNAHTRLPFHGVGAFYGALHRAAPGGATNPLFYVSSSPWNLYDLLEEFFALHGLPPGPLLLRDLGLDRRKLIQSSHDSHKLEQIRRVLETYPELPAILLGDSGQRDPEIYRRVLDDHPGRVLAIYLRDVVTGEARDREVHALAREAEALDVPMLLVADTVAAARHAAAKGWIAEADLEAVRAERERDEARPTPEKAAVEAST